MDVLSSSWSHGFHAQAFYSPNVSYFGSTTAHSLVDVQRLDGISPGSRAVPLVLGTYIPAAVCSLIILCDLLSSIRYPQSLQRVFATLTVPFRNFLTIDDLEDVGGPVPQALWKSRVLALSSLVQSFAWLSVLVYAQTLNENSLSAEALVGLLTWLYSSLRVLTKPPVTPPYLLLLLYLAHATAAAVYLIFDSGDAHTHWASVALQCLRCLVPIGLVWVAGTLPMRAVLPAKNVAKDEIPSSELTMPEDSVSLWSWLTFSFVEPLFEVSNKRTLNDVDVWSLSPFFQHANLFKKYLEYYEKHPTHSLWRFLLVTNSLDLIIDVSLDLYYSFAGFVPPYALQRILAALADPSPGARTTAYIFTVVTFLVHLSFAQQDVFKSWHSRRAYERTRGQLFCALHYKALKRRDLGGKTSHDDEDSGSADLGKVVNLMQGDAYAVAQRFWDFSDVITSPVRLVIAMVFLYSVLGWSSWAAVIVILVAYVLNYPLGKYNIYVTRMSWKARDKRMSMVNELFQNIRFLKFYGWETRWAHRVHESREAELRWRVVENIVSTAMAFIWTWIPSATALSAFLCYTLIAGERLTVAKAFTSIALFTQLQQPMSAFPMQIFAWLHAYVSMQRIQTFLDEPEVPDWASSLKATSQPPADVVPEIGFDNATFEWSEPTDTPSRFVLGPLDLRFPVGKLTLVSGPTGSGKSALLAALLGEMHCTSGHVLLNKAGHFVGYCAQNPWLENATIRENIIFGARFGYDEARYNTVIHACALNRDLEIFEAGDMTEIGEKGITLSGGQRARIALARALYSQAKCILLDDPLAAVDMHTAQHLMQNALTGDLARDRTIILVTHHITLCLPAASYLVELSGGSVLRKGSIQELRSQGQLEKLVEAEDVITEEKQVEPTELVDDPHALSAPADVKPLLEASKGKLIEAEARAEGRVTMRTYVTYIIATGIFAWLMTVLLMVLMLAVQIGKQFYLAKWGEAYEQSTPEVFHYRYAHVLSPSSIFAGLPPPDQNVVPWLLIYLWISLFGGFVMLAYIALGYYASLQASRSLFYSMLQRLARAPSRFFDVTPIGRILNRFTTDMNTVDNALQNSARAALFGVMAFVFSFTTIVLVVPAFAPFALVIAWLYVRLAPAFVQASRDLRRLESVSLSPAMAGFDELLRGLPHVRAFGMEQRYQDRFYQRVDKFQAFDHVYWLVSIWLRWRYDCLGSVVVFMSTLFALWSSVSSGMAALVIVQAGSFAEASRQLVKVLAQMELDFNSVERIGEYLVVPEEAPAIIADSRPPAYWPSSSGEVVVEDLVVKYAPDLPDVLHKISFTVKPSEKIGVVGRTGSGKSTLALSLLRMVEPTSGRIIIDNIDISKIGLDDLRSRITIISQDVSLFSGTIRSNLDPFGEHSDAECMDVIERCHLLSVLKTSSKTASHAEITLDTPISQTGSLSAGERQLVALARAVLRRSSVVIMDEATSQIDAALDDQIQRTMREEFAGAIVITIAHRLKTVLDYDRILVLGAGEIVEFDTPRALVARPGGVFREMCRASADWQALQAAMAA